MRKTLTLLLSAALIFIGFGCAAPTQDVDILATTAPVFTFTSQLCADTELVVDCMITENIACLHDYTLQTSQMRAIEGAQLVVISGAGLEEAFSDALPSEDKIIDASIGIELLCSEQAHAHEDHEASHHHDKDPHIWLSPQNAISMVNNITAGLTEKYPQHKDVFEKNRIDLVEKLQALDTYGKETLSNLKHNELITFHDGFSYLADAFGLHIVHAIEEESGREASAAELIYICRLVREHQLSAVFTEKSGSVTAAKIISAEAGVTLSSLDMAMSGDYFTAMYYNINTLKEALG